MPREFEIERGITADFDDEALDALIAQVKAELLANSAEKPMLIEERPSGATDNLKIQPTTTPFSSTS
jgi:hypothetical protein